MIRTANPALSAEVFSVSRGYAEAETMTIEGTVNRSFVLISLLLLTATPTWWLVMSGRSGAASLVMFGGVLAGFILALVTIFKKTAAPITAPLYALAEGAALGGISAMFEGAWTGIVLQAVMLTVGIFLALLFAYRSRLIQATENFKLGVVAATGGICLVYLGSMIAGLFGVQVPYLHSGGPIGIGISLVIVVIAALNLVLDFDFIEHGAEQGAPKYMEWYAAFGLLVTLVWLYLEILRLLSKMRQK